MKGHIKLLAYILLTILIVSLFPRTLSNYVLLLFPVLFLYSKNNYFWIVYYFVLVERFGGFFSGGELSSINRLPYYSLGFIGTITFEQIMIIVAFIKALKKKDNFNPKLKAFYIAFVFLFIVLVAYSMTVDSGDSNFKMIIRIAMHLTLYYSFYHLIKSEEDWNNFFRLLFPFAFYAIGFQIYSLLYGQRFSAFLGMVDLNTGKNLIDPNLEFKRPFEMIEISFLSFFFSLYFYIRNDNKFNKSYLLTLNLVSFISIFITGTRSWLLALFIPFLILILLNKIKIGKFLFRYGLIAIVMLFTIGNTGFFETQINNAFNRFETIKFLMQGDVSAGGTLQRYDVRAPALIKSFKDSNLFLGDGFTNRYFEKSDSHVGFHNYLYNTGIIGFSLLIIFIISFYIQYAKSITSLMPSNQAKDALFIFPLAFLGILILNGGTQVIGYEIVGGRPIVLMVIFYFGEFVQKTASRTDSIIRNSYAR